MKIACAAALAAMLGTGLVPTGSAAVAATVKFKPHNVVIFVADGLRYDSVNEKDSPTLARIRHDGVDFQNSHSIYPTLTTANASAIATGHYLGDTGDYANTLYVGFPVTAKLGPTITFLEDDATLSEVKQHFASGYMGPTSLLKAARDAGLSTAVVGKLGPAAIQDIDTLGGHAILIDDVTGRTTGADGLPSGRAPVDAALSDRIKAVTGTDQPPVPAVPNVAQQEWLSSVTAKALLPYLKDRGKPFVLLFWSRDPDASQHAQQDGLGSLVPGINGPTSKAAIANADNSLKSIMGALDTLGLAKSTDVFVTADHGFMTIAKSVPGPDGDIPPAHLPQGFLALSVSQWLGMKLFDPDAGNALLDPLEHPSRGNGLIGNDPQSPSAAVAANGGSDLIWFEGAETAAHAKTVFDQLMKQDYVSGIFVDDALMKASPAAFAGALPLSAIRLSGSAPALRPSMIVNFRSFPVKGCEGTPLLCGAEIADTNLTVGQGMHGGFSRAETRNFMAAAGPDFRAGFADSAPIGNTDIAPTIARVLHLKMPGSGGALRGRVLTEALKAGKAPAVTKSVVKSAPGADGLQTVLQEQKAGGAVYFDAAGFPGRTLGLEP